MGVVYEAHDRERDCSVALKTLRTREPGAILRLKHEFRALRDLTHRNLVSFGELFEADGNWFFTMELVRGVDLLTWVRASASDAADASHAIEPVSATTVGGVPGKTRSSEPDVSTVTLSSTRPARPPPPLDEPRLRAALRQLAEGLVALHDADKVHRDIKPSNILVSAESRVVVLDFGLVADVEHASRERDGDGEVAGTLLFMAPEQTVPGPVGPPADWYAVGVLLYIALTGRPPFVGARELLFELKRGGMPTPPRALAPQVARDLDALCLDLLQPDPAGRPDGRAVLQRLGAAASAPARDPGRSVKDAPFVGREEELAELRRAFTDSRRGRVAVLVHGESGVGKSTLVRHFTDELAAGDAVVLTGRCYERESVPYKAIDEIVDG
ncbi:MAG: serine/threonine-protein kinase, partial [Acidobacteriota bacterium]